MARLTATRSVLYQNRLYQPGDELPQHDTAMVSAWLEAGSAKRETEAAPAASAPAPAAPKAATTSGKAKSGTSTKKKASK